MSKGGGGGYDTSGMERATQQATDLQERIYEEGVQRGMPFYQAGVGALGKLSDYLGIDQTPVQRQSIYDRLLPEYTTTTPASGNIVTYDSQGAMVKPMTREEYIAKRATLGAPQASELDKKWFAQWEDPADLSKGVKGSMGATGGTSVTDYAGLNAAVDAQMGSQEKPEYYGSLLEGFDVDKFGLDPSYDFIKGEGEKAIERAMAAKGQTYSPATEKALMEYGKDLASTEYGRAFDRYNVEQQNIYNRLMGLTGVGQGQQAQLTASGAQYASDVGQSLGSLAQAQAAAQQAKASDRSSMFGNLLQLGGTLGAAALTGGGSLAATGAAGLSTMPYTSAMLFASDKRLKENIELVGEKNGHNIYHFNYKGSDKRYEGVMAQEVLDKMPEAVIDVGGHLAVYYDKLGLEMKEVN